MQAWLKKFLGMNWVLLLATGALIVYGIYAIYSATWTHPNASFWRSQMTWVVIGLPIFFVLTMLDYAWVRIGVIPLYVLGLLTLIANRFLGTGVETWGARRWLNLGFVSFQPSQLAVLATLLTVAVLLEILRGKPDWLRLVLVGAVAFPPWILIFSEPDLGSSLVLVPIVLGMLFVGGIAKRWLVSILLLAAACIPIVINFLLKEYQMKRILIFLNPNLDPSDAGYNINQSLIAIGSGGMHGKGFQCPDSLTALGFLPQNVVHNDFVFSVMGEQHGFVGAVILLAVFLVFLLMGLSISLHARDDLGRLIAFGAVMLFFTHIAMNVGMTISVMPITGLPLPLVSYGGTFLVITLMVIGLMQSVWVHRKDASDPNAGSL